MRRLEAVIFDWAGTTVDFGSLAPVRAIMELFARERVPINDADARRDMGIFKKDHIRRVLDAPHVEAAWLSQYGKPPTETDVEDLFAKFIPLQLEVLEEHSRLILSAGHIAQNLKSRGLRIASTTGYTRPMLEVLLASAAEQGYRPEISLCPDDTGGGRPLPWMCLRIALEFQLSSTAAAAKVGDAISDIEEALNAGMWAVGVAGTGNEIGLSAEDFAALPESERDFRLARARERLQVAGAHYVVDSVAAIEPVIERIDERLSAGERP